MMAERVGFGKVGNQGVTRPSQPAYVSCFQRLNFICWNAAFYKAGFSVQIRGRLVQSSAKLRSIPADSLPHFASMRATSSLFHKQMDEAINRQSQNADAPEDDDPRAQSCH